MRKAWKDTRKRAANLTLSVVAAALLVACTYQGGIDRQTTIKFTWFSYVNGDDIRQSCGQGTDFLARFVYNGDYNKQLRNYEVVADGAGGAYIVARAMGGKDVSSLLLDRNLDLWGWKKSQAKLDAAAFDRFKARLRESDAYGGAPDGLRLRSNRYYWVAVICRQGEIAFNAWQHPSDRYERLSFPETLLAADGTGVAFRQAREVDGFQADPYQRSGRVGDQTGPYFELEVDGNALAR